MGVKTKRTSMLLAATAAVMSIGFSPYLASASTAAPPPSVPEQAPQITTTAVPPVQPSPTAESPDTPSDPTTAPPETDTLSPSTPQAPTSTQPSASPGKRLAPAAVTAGCQTYPPTTFEVCGRIRDKYNQTGGPTGFLLLPKSNELTNPGNTGKRSEFLGGNIYWSAATDAHPVAHDFLTKWGEKGYETGYLKYPTTDEIVLSDGTSRRQEYQGGSIYFKFGIGPHTIQGTIRDKWASLGGQAGYLGFPTTDEMTTPDGKGRYNYFEHGAIYWSAATGAYAISGSILDQWASAGYEKSSYGYPVADHISSPGTATEQRFQNGRIYSSGVRVPLGNTGLAFSLGLGSTNALTAGQTDGTTTYAGSGFDLGFTSPASGRIITTTLSLKASQAPRQFKMLVGLPNGRVLQQSGSRVNIVDGAGTVEASVRTPLAFSASGQTVPVQVSVSGNQITYTLNGNFTFPGTMKFYASDYDDDLGDWETNQTCFANPIDCGRAYDDKALAFKWSEEDFPDHMNADGTVKYRNDALDADRHCLWQGLTTESSNAGFAEELGNAHEQDVPGGNGTNAGKMDQYNNITGRAVGRRNENNRNQIRLQCKTYAQNPRVITDISTMGTNTDADDLVILEGEANTAG